MTGAVKPGEGVSLLLLLLLQVLSLVLSLLLPFSDIDTDADTDTGDGADSGNGDEGVPTETEIAGPRGGELVFVFPMFVVLFWLITMADETGYKSDCPLSPSMTYAPSCKLELVSACVTADRPKSAILRIAPSEGSDKSRFSGFRSRWTTPFSWQYLCYYCVVVMVGISIMLVICRIRKKHQGSPMHHSILALDMITITDTQRDSP